MHEAPPRAGKALVDGYGPGFFRVSGEVMAGPIVICEREAKSWGGFRDVESITSLVSEIDVLLVGTGAEAAPVPEGFGEALEHVGIMMEFMPTPSACRTFNVLVSEGRRVAVALLPLAADS